ncbi:MAG TPA: alkaline phosphatase family protein [Hyphomicrobiales bacterium]|nr:alkaline phosphatase family protein [Hyphomicrobiales bacterium]
MTRKIWLLVGVLTLASASMAQTPLLPRENPRLVLVMVVDQMRYDYLTRYGTEFDSGLARLVREGAVFTNANYEAAPTMTAVGHSTILTGATPSSSGIAGNTWYEREEGRSVQSVTDDTVMALGGGNGASPRRLAVTTVGDELKASGKGGKVFGVSLKDRGAILPAGRGADGAYWLVNGTFASSSWYFPALPEWVQRYNAAKPADRYAGAQWLEATMPTPAGPELYRALDSTPFADQLVLDFALTLLREEALGTDAQTDLLSVSFSAVDYVGHASGPDTPLMHDMILNIDKRIGELLTSAERQAGRGKVLAVLTADHGVSPVPEELEAKGLPGGRYDTAAERDAVEQALSAAFGEAEYIEAAAEMGYYLKAEPLAGTPIAAEDLQRVAAAALRGMPHVARVYTRHELETRREAGDRIDQRVRNGFSPLHSGDVLVVHEPNWLGNGYRGTTHGSPYSYDTHVPLIFWGPKTLVKPGLYHADAGVHDLAPTLATMLRVATPSGALGRVLNEIMP